MQALRDYARQLGLNVVARADGSFYISDDNGRDVFSVIRDYSLFETWGNRNRGPRRGRNTESVKRSLRRIAKGA